MLSITSKRLCFRANPEKPAAAKALENLRAFAATRCTVVDGVDVAGSRPDRVVVIGGDGTLIGVARSMGRDQVPLIGVNVGKLGFLTEFSVDEVRRNFDEAVGNDSLISKRMVLDVAVFRGGQSLRAFLAINDCVIQAGPPFRIIHLGMSVDGEPLTDLDGDGVIVSTPIGSTAHSLSAGGPIMQPGVEAIILTPMNPHSLTHKPLVIERDSVIEVEAMGVNAGTTLIIDGQVSCPLQKGDCVRIKRFDTEVLVVRNPVHSVWHKLVTKLHWGRRPESETAGM